MAEKLRETQFEMVSCRGKAVDAPVKKIDGSEITGRLEEE